jgi:hypothetical protein
MLRVRCALPLCHHPRIFQLPDVLPKALGMQFPMQLIQWREVEPAFDDMAALNLANRHRAEDQWLAKLPLPRDGVLRMTDVSDRLRAFVDRQKLPASLHP